ncbi:MAG: thiamine-phosphate kinase [Deltaproteobacteria bacterium]|nr:thiamine-phosphate kinase [Deltaproteobacteria bacterium]
MNKVFGEFDLIHLLTHQRGYQRPEVLCGVGDDCAVIEEPGRCLLFTCDAQVAGTHFFADRITPYALGARIAAVNLSDIAAMGGRPLWALCSLLLDDTANPNYCDELYSGLYEVLGQHQVHLIGGNTARSDGGLVADLFLAGEASRQAVLYRSGATAGDIVCVSGTIGDSAAGFRAITSLTTSGNTAYDVFSPLVQRHYQPIPRIDVGQLLAYSGSVTSCIDISDGLLQDARHLAAASGVRIEIDDTLLPVSELTRQLASVLGIDIFELALTGGEDYELLFTVKECALNALERTISDETGISITPIGTVRPAADARGTVQTATEKYGQLAKGGFDHLRQRSEK